MFTSTSSPVLFRLFPDLSLADFSSVRDNRFDEDVVTSFEQAVRDSGEGLATKRVLL